jgi:putative SOS response-associated peptidase YedK
MCGRITQKSPPSQLGLQIVDLVEEDLDAPPRYNGAPGQQHWVIRQHPETGKRVLSRLTWGLIPNWVKDASPKLKSVNATAERVGSAAMFRGAYAKRRCIIPIDNYFEWRAIKGSKAKQPYAIGLKSGEPFGIGGLWESWKHPVTGIVHRTFCVITTTPNEILSEIHDRMPLILPPEAYDRWLATIEPDPRDLLVPFPSELMLIRPISARVNKYENDDADILRPADDTPSLI